MNEKLFADVGVRVNRDVPVKCEYCGQDSNMRDMNCSHCGGPLKIEPNLEPEGPPISIYCTS